MKQFIFFIGILIILAFKSHSQCTISPTILTEWSCNTNTGRILAVVLSGGVPPFTYTFDYGTPQSSNIFSNVAAGNHHIKIQDAVCFVEYDKSLTPNSNLGGNADLSEIACGKVTILPYSGYPPYLLSINGGVFQTSPVFTGLTAATYNVVIKDTSSCIASVAPIVVTTNPLTVTSAKVNALCPGSSTGSITLTSANGTPPYSYSINNEVSFQASNIFTGLSAGIYDLVVKDFNGCKYTKRDTIVNTLSGVSATVSTQNTACSGSPTGSIAVTTTGGVSPFNYSLDAGAIQSSNIFTGVSAGVHSIVVTDVSGCLATIAATVNNNSGVNAISIVTNAGCPGSATGKITVNASTGVMPYEYSLNGGAYQSSNIFTGLSANTYNLKVKDAANCMFNLIAVVNNDPLVTAALNIKEPSCFGTATGQILISPISGKAPYEYALNNSPFQTGNTFNNLIKGSYMVHIRDANGCVKDTTVVLNEPLLLSAIADTSASTCIANDGTITVNASGGTSPYLYSGGNNNFQSGNILKVGPGNYNVTVKDNRGCLFNTTAKITLIDDMFLDIGIDTTSCFGIPVNITPVTNIGTTVFNWTPKNGNLNSSTGAYSVTPSDTTKYFLTATYGVCQHTDSVSVNILRKPIADAGKDSIICEKTTAFLHGNASNLSGSVSFLWSPANDLTSRNTDTTTATPTTYGPHTYILEVSDNYGCNFKVTDAVIVTMNAPPPAFAGNDTICAMNLPHQLVGRGGAGYAWSPGGFLNNPNLKNPIAILSRDTKFVLTVTDNAGCTAADTIDIKVFAGPTYYIPNAFTPNSDGLNDIFRAIPPGIEKTDYFRIFNRWGQLLFETHQYMKGWDGNYIGKPQPNGIYVWEIKGIDKFGRVINKIGYVMLIR